MTTLPEETSFPKDTLRLTRQEFPPPEEGTGNLSILTAAFAQLGDRIQPWGAASYLRDRQLRAFWPSESYLASAIYSVCIRNSAFEWEVKVKGEGRKGTRLETALTDMMNGSQAGQDFGWIPFISAISEDIYTQDNGMFIELIRDPTIDAGSKFKNENAPVIGLAHLDAGKCVRTGNPMKPVVYYDREDNPHIMNWWDIIGRAESPSAIETMNGIGYCAVTRVLRVAQIMESIEIYKDEKIGGRQFGMIHFVSGPSKKELDDTLEREMEKADNQGYTRFMTPAIVVSLDPEKPVTTANIEFASLPDNFDLDQELKWYISVIALGLGSDYQDFAPLPSGNIGSSAQSEILHRKSRGKGPAHFMESFQNWMRDYGVIPRIAEFKFKIKDRAEELEEVEKHKAQAELLAILRRADIVDGVTAREIVKSWDMVESEIIDKIPEDFGNQEFGGTKQMLGTAGGSTTGEDAKRVEKFRKFLKGLRRGKNTDPGDNA
jgi:hypothetical protein